jgi:hypothetical protein
MADDNSARYRSNDSFDRGPAAPASDPLAELARLIGQNDPFSEYGRTARPAAPSPQPAPDLGPRFDPSLPAPPSHSEPVQPYAHEPAAHLPPAYEPAPRYSPEPAPPYRHDTAPRYAADYPPRAYDDQAGHNDWPVPAPPPAPSRPSNDPFALPRPPFVPQPAPHHDNTGYASPNFGSQPYVEPPARPAREGYPPDLPGFDAPAAYAGAPDRQNYPPLYPHEPEAGGMPVPHDDEFYDDEPRGGRRKGLLTVIAVLGLAVLGTAGAFGYRSMFGHPGSSGPVPVIRASGEPSKVAPPPPTADQSQSAGKFSYDRFGDAGKDEQVVRREEKPVDLSKAPQPTPRTVFPGAPVASPPSAKSAGGAAMSAANPPSAIGEPRRVRTVPIRPDQGGDVAAAPPSQQPPSQQLTSVAPPRQVNAAAANVAAPAPDDTPGRAAAARASSRTALRSTPPPAPAPAANAPLSLSPDANNNAPPPVAQDNFPPPPPPRASAPPPARVASAPPAATAGGSYLVQVSSQRSEAEAESAYRGIQSKFGSVLGSQPHTVRRADLGAKGVYYRAMVGPFASREEAVQVCSSLKQAGGECVVQH